MKLNLSKLNLSSDKVINPYDFKAQYNDKSIVVYQAFKKEIADYAIVNQKLGGDKFSFKRRTWIKPSFLWMMYRSGWAEKKDQKNILAIHLSRSFFDHLISLAVPTNFDEKYFGDFTSIGKWKNAYHHSDVVAQMDPERNYNLYRTGRRAIQLGLKNEKLEKYALDEILLIEDITSFVKEQSKYIQEFFFHKVMLPTEKVYISKMKT